AAGPDPAAAPGAAAGEGLGPDRGKPRSRTGTAGAADGGVAAGDPGRPDRHGPRARRQRHVRAGAGAHRAVRLLGLVSERRGLLFLSQADVVRLLDIDLLLEALAKAFVELSAGRTSVPPRIAARTPSGGLLGAMPGYSGGVLEAKLVSVFPQNHVRGLPSHQGLIVLFDENTGAPIAVMDGVAITAIRTGASAAVAARW